jgi:hypothetical protein
MSTSDDRVEVRLRYRPSGDHLIAEAVFETIDEIVDELDADTSVTWARRAGDTPDDVVLSSFSIVGARRRFRDTSPDFVPSSVWRVASSMLASLPVAPRGSMARLEARADATVVVSLTDLRRPRDVSRSSTSGIAPARAVASALRDLASSMQLALDSFDAADPEMETPARRFVRGLHHMSSLVAAHRTSTPSAVADLSANLRGGLPLTERERQRLRSTLDRLLDPDQWKEAALELNNLAAAVRGERRLDRPEGT